MRYRNFCRFPQLSATFSFTATLKKSQNSATLYCLLLATLNSLFFSCDTNLCIISAKFIKSVHLIRELICRLMYYLNISSCNLLIMGWNENAANSVTGYFNHVTVNELIDIWTLLSRLHDYMRRKQWHTLKLCEILLPWYTNCKVRYHWSESYSHGIHHTHLILLWPR